MFAIVGAKDGESKSFLRFVWRESVCLRKLMSSPYNPSHSAAGEHRFNSRFVIRGAQDRAGEEFAYLRGSSLCGGLRLLVHTKRQRLDDFAMTSQACGKIRRMGGRTGGTMEESGLWKKQRLHRRRRCFFRHGRNAGGQNRPPQGVAPLY